MYFKGGLNNHQPAMKSRQEKHISLLMSSLSWIVTFIFLYILSQAYLFIQTFHFKADHGLKSKTSLLFQQFQEKYQQ